MEQMLKHKRSINTGKSARLLVSRSNLDQKMKGYSEMSVRLLSNLMLIFYGFDRKKKSKFLTRTCS